MGLDLFLVDDKDYESTDDEEEEEEDNHNWSVGVHSIGLSYRGYLELRWMVLHATIEHVKQNEPKLKIRAKLLKTLETWIRPRLDDSILDHSTEIVFHKIQPLQHLPAVFFTRNYLIGLHKLVRHSDTDGHLSYGDAADIVELFDTVQVPTADDESKEWIGTIVEFFKTSVKEKKSIRFC
jgi:hypothetical protein